MSGETFSSLSRTVRSEQANERMLEEKNKATVIKEKSRELFTGVIRYRTSFQLSENHNFMPLL